MGRAFGCIVLDIKLKQYLDGVEFDSRITRYKNWFVND